MRGRWIDAVRQLVDVTISRVRLRDLAALGRARRAARRRTGADGAAIAAGTSPRPSTPSSRPGTDDLMASTI
jgi:hypothetical protein